MQVTIDTGAGFCFGVEQAIRKAENELSPGEKLYCLEDLVHNTTEMQRLRDAGLEVVSHDELLRIPGKRLMLRAHGEPPSTYLLAKQLGIELVDATCPIVMKLQERIRRDYEESSGAIQLVIIGKEGHPEVTGLRGQTNNQAIVVGSEAEIDRIDFSRPVRLYAQTTIDQMVYDSLAEAIRKKMTEQGNEDLVVNRSFCRQVSGRSKGIRSFAASHDVILFVSDPKSSNGAFLFQVCREANPRSYFICEPSDVDYSWLDGAQTVGITGATSTPAWLMQQVADAITSGGVIN